jgi:hypothetical protein
MAQIDTAESHWGELQNNFARWAPKIKQFFFHNPQSFDQSTYPKLQRAGSGAFGTVIKVISPETVPNDDRPPSCSRMVASNRMR